MNRFLILLFLVSTSSAVLKGQGQNQALQRAQSALEHVDLSPRQKEQIKSIRVKYKDLLKYNHNSQKDAMEKRKKAKFLQQDMRSELRQVLTPSQHEEYRILMKKRRTEQPRNRVLQAVSQLNLNDDQLEKIKLAIENQKFEFQRIRQSKMPDAAKREQVKSVRKNINKELRSILTTEQYKQLQQEMKLATPDQKERNRRR